MFLKSFGHQTPAAEEKFHGGGSVIGLRSAEYPAPSYLNWADHGYGRNELVYACVTEKATSTPEAPLRVYRDVDGRGEADEMHPLRQLVRRPNEVTSEFELWELTIMYLEIGGMAPWWVVRDRLGNPVELWPIRPDRLRVIPNADRRIHHTYAVQLDEMEAPISLGRDVVNFKYPHPTNEYIGMPPLAAALRATSLDNTATDFVKSLLTNDATPTVAIKTAQAVDKDMAERLKEDWKAKYGGSKRGEPAVLQVGMEIEALGFNLSDLEFPDLRTISETRICAAFRVPPILVGAKAGLDRSTFSNTQEARRAFWEQTIMPLQRRLSDTITLRLLPEFEATGTVHFDNGDVVALREAQKDKWDRATQAFRAGGITRNQYLRELGLPEIGPAGDVFMTPAGVIPVPVNQAGEPVEPETLAAYATAGRHAPRWELTAQALNGGN